MFFLFRAAFWLTIVFLALPPEERPSLATGPLPAQEATVAIAASARDAVTDACLSEPQTCADGALIAAELGHRAARMVSALSSLATQAGAPDPAPVAR